MLARVGEKTPNAGGALDPLIPGSRNAPLPTLAITCIASPLNREEGGGAIAIRAAPGMRRIRVAKIKNLHTPARRAPARRLLLQDERIELPRSASERLHQLYKDLIHTLLPIELPTQKGPNVQVSGQT